jgi:hypothetical protein
MRAFRILFSVVLVLLGFGIAGQVELPAPPFGKCPGNIVQNGGFDVNTVLIGDGSMPPSTTAAWTRAYGTPQLQGGAGCNTPDYVSFWGNQVVGEAIQQPVNLIAGRTYRVSFCARFHPEQGKNPTFVRIVLRGSTAPLPNPQCPSGTCETLVTTANITSQTWINVNACFTPARNESILTVSPSNGSSVNDGAEVSWGQVDDFCISEVKAPVIEGPPSTCTSPATYCVKPPATGPFNWSVTNGTSMPANADGSCVVVTWNSPSGGALHVTSNVNGCPVSSDLKVAECNHKNCCLDQLNSTSVTGQDTGTNADIAFALNGGPAVTVKATVLSAWRSWTPGCGTNGPIAVSASATQPSAPAGWQAPVVPLLNGNQVVWQSSAPNGSSIAGPFHMNVDLPPGGPGKCKDTINICIQFEVTFPATATQPCHTCSIVRCFKFTRCKACT